MHGGLRHAAGRRARPPSGRPRSPPFSLPRGLPASETRAVHGGLRRTLVVHIWRRGGHTVAECVAFYRERSQMQVSECLFK